MAEPTAIGQVPAPPFGRLVRDRPLLIYFVVAFAGSWLVLIPLVLSQRGLNVIAIPDALTLVSFLLAPYAGPFLAAFLLTGIGEGRAGVRRLLRWMLQWRVGLRWYLLVLLGYPLVYVIGFTPVLGAAPLGGLAQNWPLLFTSYLPGILVSILIDGIAEETGWRGFALPRLQLGYGALTGSLILGGLLALWHLPAYFLPGAILPGAFDPTVFALNSLSIVVSTLLWTWTFNNTRGSILFAILVHATSNGTSSLIPQLFAVPDDPWATPVFFGLCALLVVLVTRGRLGFVARTALPTVSPDVLSSDGTDERVA